MQPTRKPVIEYIGYLDSVRGIAALMVLFYHFIGWHWQNNAVHIASMFFNGSDAVSFFFVLSGFVLSYKYLVLEHSLDLRKFYINRIFRLMPAYMFVVLIQALYWNRTALNGHNMADLFVYNNQGFWNEMFLPRAQIKFYGAGWTLVIELVISFFVPFAIALARYNRKLLLGLLVCILLEGSFISYFHIHFVLGVLLSAYYYDITTGVFRAKKWYRYRFLVLLGAIALYSIRHLDRISPLGTSLKNLLAYLNLDFFLFTGIASFVFIAFILSSAKAQKFLDQGIWRFYGRISYGIYLIHWLIVSIIFDYWSYIYPLFGTELAAFFVMLPVCLGVSTVLALLIHYAIELPFLRYGKRLTHKLKPSLVIGAPPAATPEK